MNALSKIILGSLLCQRLWSPTLALREVWMQNRHQSTVPHIWRALCARYGKPQISPLRFAPVEMTKLGVNANQTFLNPISIPLGGPQAHERSGQDDQRFTGGNPAFSRELRSQARELSALGTAGKASLPCPSAFLFH